MGSRGRMVALATNIKKANKKLTIDDLIRMYESDGITPDFLLEAGAIESIPASFYTKLAALHTEHTAAQSQKPIVGVDGLAPTKLLYYEDESTREFEATVLRVVDKRYVALDQTAFYPRGGGQEPDKGKLDNYEVVEVF